MGQLRIRKPYVITRTIAECGACGGKHRGVSFSLLKVPISVGDERFTHRGICPSTRRELLTVITPRTK